MKEPIHIVNYASISPLGTDAKAIWKKYLSTESCINQTKNLSADLSSDALSEINKLADSKKRYKSLDNSVLFAMFVSKKAFKLSGWNNESEVGINIGSSRGATELFEKYHQEFLTKGATSTLASPTTTLGNISSWVASDLQVEGPTISHSITCSTALHSILNGIAWINAGMSDRFMVGGSESANTDFTIAQMKALKIYSNSESALPCQSLDLEKKENTMVLGEGAAVFCLEKASEKQHIAKIIGVGYATELVKHNVSISTNAICFQKSMAMALVGFDKKVDAIVMHAPGTVKGDQSEFNAIKAVFKTEIPALTSNKWKIGHSLGASGALSIEMAILMLQNQTLIESPFYQNEHQPNELKTIMVNAVGFGGNAVSILITL